MALDDTVDPTASLLSLLTLSPADGTQTDEDSFVGGSRPEPQKRVFGGQVLGQSLVAATHTVEPDRLMHSMHAYFLRPGDTEVPITFGVERLRDGRSFSARRTHAYQNGVPILSMIASFQVPGEGLDHQVEMPEGIPEPESLPTTAELLKGIDHPVAKAWSHQRPMDIRHVEKPVYFEAGPDKVARNAVWMKSFGPLPDDQNLHRAALAYASDYTLLESVLRRHGLAWSARGMSIASLDHAMWWHRPLRVDDWLLYVQESPSASGARGLASGRIFNRAGELVATVAQEGMVRVPDQP
ncbi:acyl-CoA thioesterase II [Arthrobacter sp. zg-Y820]|uniref:acyl-CoA thioesterase n=1 Tax=unclassified Arthrobacter TaxID=235627 RepID=UPI001E397948|nr:MULTISPECIES: acyl-CoA thioesterase II [unclassified Arthrobacter]MCC9196302.1 acyl-CoA thioesterase II [Arthrobacter sp. zg-Y820]MDK1279163.1 acyl-CoA thioesterase II [Arthrobacter sp. zg.Y820]MDK1359221.1 acyl-CoA thioesterase II [Arthrobacter sp. zg-Y1219]WIB08434.1 acyl-CoA thioesterase II [Arthrobacter sp. zg-Y820]